MIRGPLKGLAYACIHLATSAAKVPFSSTTKGLLETNKLRGLNRRGNHRHLKSGVGLRRSLSNSHL